MNGIICIKSHYYCNHDNWYTYHIQNGTGTEISPYHDASFKPVPCMWIVLLEETLVRELRQLGPFVLVRQNTCSIFNKHGFNIFNAIYHFSNHVMIETYLQSDSNSCVCFWNTFVKMIYTFITFMLETCCSLISSKETCWLVMDNIFWYVWPGFIIARNWATAGLQ